MEDRGFLSFAQTMGKNIDNKSKNLSCKYSHKLLDHAKQSATAEATGDLIGNKIAAKITKVSRNSPQKSSGSVESETENIGLDGEIPKEQYKSPEKKRRNY